jgi:hypothetical protein
MPLLSPRRTSGRDCRETCSACTRCFLPAREMLITEPPHGISARHNDQLLLDPHTNRGARFKVYSVDRRRLIARDP